MTRKEIEAEYKIDKYGRIRDLGKFESEMLYAPYFYDASLDGCAEELSFEQDGCGEYAALLEVTSEDRAEFPELDADTAYVLITESEQGFVGAKELTTNQAKLVRQEYENQQKNESEEV